MISTVDLFAIFLCKQTSKITNRYAAKAHFNMRSFRVTKLRYKKGKFLHSEKRFQKHGKSPSYELNILECNTKFSSWAKIQGFAQQTFYCIRNGSC